MRINVLCKIFSSVQVCCNWKRMRYTPLPPLSTSVPPHPARWALRADCEPLCSAPAPAPAPPPGTTALPAALSAEPETGTGNELASQSENSGPGPEGRKEHQVKTTKTPQLCVSGSALSNYKGVRLNPKRTGRESLELLSSIYGSDQTPNKT